MNTNFNKYQMKDQLYIIKNEPGFSEESLPTWTDRGNIKDLFDEEKSSQVSRVDIPEVPGAFQLLNVLSEKEADNFVNIANELGFHEDSPVSLPHHIRHNQNLNWIVSNVIDETIWNRSKEFVNEEWNGETAKAINARFRFYRYNIGDFFSPHSDGSWPGSRVIDNKLIADAYPGLFSQYTFLILLSDDFEGGRTQFMVSKLDPSKPAKSDDDTKLISISTPKGSVLCFPHGTHPLHCTHTSERITKGAKYIIRTDILFA